MSMKTHITRFARASVAAALALSVSTVAVADDPDLTVYKEGSVPLKKPDMALGAIPPYALNSRLYTFPTGLRILMQADPSHPIVSIHTIVDHGSSDDFEGKEGLAHFVEHTWFKSQHTYVEPITGKETELPKIMDLIQDFAGTFNASTWSDITDYSTVASTEFLDLMMQMESWRLTEPYKGVEASEIAVETEVILNEWRRRNEQGSNLIWDYAGNAAFPDGHEYGARSTKESLDRIQLEDLQKYFDMYYKPSETTIVVVGDFDINESDSIIFRNMDWALLDPRLDKELDKWQAPRPGITDPDPDNPDHWLMGALDPGNRDGERVAYKLVPDDEYTPRVPSEPDTKPIPKVDQSERHFHKVPMDGHTAVVVWPLPAGYRPDEDSLDMVSSLANSVVGSGLDPIWVGQPDPMPDIDFQGCGFQPQEVNSMIFCAASFKPWKDSLENVADKIVNQIPQIWNPDMAYVLENQQFNRARAAAMRDILFNIDRVATIGDGRAKDLGLYLHFTGDYKVHSRKLNNAATLDFPTVSQLAKKYLTRDNYALMQLSPIPKDERDVANEGSAYAGAAAEDHVMKESRFEVTNEDIANSWVAPKLDALEDFKLPNGMRVVALKHGEVPMVQATLILGGGTDMEPKGAWSLYNNFHRTESVDTLPFAGRFGGGNYATAEQLQVKAPSSDLDDALFTLRNYVDTIRPDMQGFGSYISRGKKRTRNNWNSESWHLRDMSYSHLYPDFDPMKSWTLADWDQMSDGGRAVVEDVLDKKMRPENATLVIVGNLEPEAMKDAAYRMFSSWKKGAGKTDWNPSGTPDMPTEKAKILIADAPRQTQTQITGACRVDYKGIDDDPAMGVLTSMVGNDMFSTIRVKEGLAYTPGGYASGNPLTKSGTLNFSVLATNAGVGRVVEYINEWVDKGEAGDFSEADIVQHKMREARSSGVSAQSVGQMSGTLNWVARNGYTWDYLMESGQRIADVEASTLKRLMQGCGDHLIVTAVGPADVIGPLLEEKGFDYEVVDWRARRDAIYMEQAPDLFPKFQKSEVKRIKKLRKECAKDPDNSKCDELDELDGK